MRGKFFLAAVGWVAFGMILGRLGGMLREMLIAARYGASSEADIAVLILFIPDFLAVLLGGGAMGAALIPAFKRLDDGRDAVLFRQASLAGGAAFAALALGLALFAGPVVRVLAPGLPESAAGGTVADLLRVTVFAIPLTVLAAVSTAYLQSKGRFAIPAFGTLLFNGALVACLLIPETGLRALAVAAILGALLRWGSQAVDVLRARLHRARRAGNLISRRLVVAYMQATLTGALAVLLQMVPYALSTLGGGGELATFNYAYKLLMFPVGIGVAVFSVALFPTLAEVFGRTGEGESPAFVSRCLQAVLTLALSMTLVLAVFRQDIATLIYGYGRMTPDDVTLVALLFGLGLIALPAQVMAGAWQSIMHAKSDTRGPLLVTLLVLAVHLPLCVIMQDLYGLPGLMVAFVVSAHFALAGQVWVAHRRHGIPLNSLMRISAVLRMAAAVCIGVLALALVAKTLDLGYVVNVILAVAGGGAVFALGIAVDGDLRGALSTALRQGLGRAG